MHPRAMSSANTQLTGKVRYRRHAPSERRLEYPVEAGPAERVARHRRGAEDGARVRAHDVLPGGCPRHGVLERRHLCDGVGIRAWLLGHRGVLALEAAARVEERAGADGDHPSHAEGLGRIENVFRPLDVHGLEVGEVLAGATQQRGTVDGRVDSRCGAPDVVCGGDIAGHDLGAQCNERPAVSRRTGEGAHPVAPLDQQLADVGTGQAGRSGDKDGLSHVESCGASA